MSLTSLNQKQSANSPVIVCKRLVQYELDDLRSAALWKAVLAEFLGCLLLIYFAVGIGLSGPRDVPATLVEGAVGSGFFIAAIVTALSAVSGAHINPALSLAFLLARQCSFVRFFFYFVAQCAGAITGAAILKSVTPSESIGNLGLLQPAKGVTSEQALMAEFMITFLLSFCTLAMVDKGRTDVKGSVPFMIGLLVTVGIFFAADISGGCMNPIRNFGPAVMVANLEKQWIYWTGPMLGGAVGAVLYDRVFSMAATPDKLKNSCMIRDRTYTTVVMEADGHNDASIPLMEKSEKPEKQPFSSSPAVPHKTPSYIGSIERVATV